MPQTPLPEQVEPFAGLSSNFELMSSKDVACHMTSYDWELFNCVHEVGLGQSAWSEFHSWPVTSCYIHAFFPFDLHQLELIYHTFARQNIQKTTVNLDLFLRRFNEIQFWVITEMCLCSQLSKRVQLLKKFIKIAAQ